MDPDENTEAIAPDGAVGATPPTSGETNQEPDDDATGPPGAAVDTQSRPVAKGKPHAKLEPDRGPFFTELWQGRPIYRCPLCAVAKTDRAGLSGDAAIRIHLERHHAPAATPEERARAAGLVISKR